MKIAHYTMTNTKAMTIPTLGLEKLLKIEKGGKIRD